MALATQSPLHMHGAEKAGLPSQGVLVCTAIESPLFIAERAAKCRIYLAPPLHNRWFPLTLGNAAPIALDPVYHPGNKTP